MGRLPREFDTTDPGELIDMLTYAIDAATDESVITAAEADEISTFLANIGEMIKKKAGELFEKKGMGQVFRRRVREDGRREKVREIDPHLPGH